VKISRDNDDDDDGDDNKTKWSNKKPKQIKNIIIYFAKLNYPGNYFI